MIEFKHRKGGEIMNRQKKLFWELVFEGTGLALASIIYFYLFFKIIEILINK